MSVGTVVMKRTLGSSQRLALPLFFTLVLLCSSGAAAFPDLRALPDCSCTDRKEAEALRDQIAKADTLEAAQELALPPAEQARAALARARWLMPFSTSLRTAEKRMADYESNVRTAKAPADVADQFGSLVRLASSGAVVSDSDGVRTSRCSYSTGEIIAIVLGFIFGIIPGIILLILLC